MFKVTNEQLIQIAAVDAGLDPYAEYCTKGVYEAAGFKVRKGEKPVLVLELWCPRERKTSAGGELLSSAESQQTGENSGASVNLFFQFKLCHLFTRSQVQSKEEIALEKEAKKAAKAQQKKFKKTVLSMGGIQPGDYEDLPAWCKRKNGLPLDVAAAEVSAEGFYCEDANGLFDMIAAV